MNSPRRPAARSSRATLLVAAALVLALERVVPYGRYLLYPFTLLGTFIHEMGHGLAAILVGGHFEKLEIFADASGLAHTSAPPGVREAFVAAGGLLAPPLVGALLLALGRGPRRAALLLGLLSASLIGSLVLFVRSPIGFVSLGPLALAIAAFAYFSDGEGRMMGARFLGLLLALDTVTRIDYLFAAHASVGGSDRPSDVAAIAHALGGPILLWGALIAGLSFALLALGLWAAWRFSPVARRFGRN